MTRNELIAQLEQLTNKYPKAESIRSAIASLYANRRYEAAQHLESEGLHDWADKCVELGNLSVHNF